MYPDKDSNRQFQEGGRSCLSIPYNSCTRTCLVWVVKSCRKWRRSNDVWHVDNM